MAEAIAEIGLEKLDTDNDRHKKVPVTFEDLEVIISSLSTQISDLKRKVAVLEQSQQTSHKHADETQDTMAQENGKEASIGQSQKLNQSEPLQIGEASQSPDHILGDFVEFREQTYNHVSNKTEWTSIDTEQRSKASQHKSFRYDTWDNGHMTFSVFKDAKLYNKLLEFCPPAHDGQVIVTEDRLDIMDPFSLLNCREKLMNLLDDPTDSKAAMSQEELTEHELKRKELMVMKRLYERRGHLLFARENAEKLADGGKIDCASLKSLFRKDGLVVFRELREEWAVARVIMVTETDDNHSLGNEVQLELQCEAIDFDGRMCRKHVYRKQIDIFSGIRDIHELPVYPLKYHSKKKELIEISIESGKRWLELHKSLTSADGEPRPAVQQVTGYCETFGENADDEAGGKGIMVSSRVIIDTGRYPDRLLQFTEDNTDPIKGADLEDTSENNPLVLCPEKILVHCMSDNTWCYAAMTRLKKTQWDSGAWETLVQPAKSGKNHYVAKSIQRIQLLAKAHERLESGESKTIDNFTGKGKGLIFLLHGPPGVGKTMVAECLSEKHMRPLYRINLGELLDDYRWESKIEQVFRQARFWGAFLLLDEAEAILAERTLENMHQSAWVAVFLRKIEYFQGIVFLTTNLIHMIDPAFISRVNLGFMIPGLDEETRSLIWQKMLKNHPSAQSLATKKGLIHDWAKKDLNGRQIRNVIHSAELMASDSTSSTGESGEIRESHINDALEDVAHFIAMIDQEKKNVEQSHLAQWSV